MANLNPFSPSAGTTLTISASGSNVNTAFNSKDVSSSTSTTGTSGSTIDRGIVGGHTVIRIYNAGTALAFGRWGKGAQTATTADMPIVPGVVEIFSKANQDDNIAFITGGSAATIYVSCGEGQ